MSMNLKFKVIGVPDEYIDFPFQTPTRLSYAVMYKCTTSEQRIRKIQDYIELIEWEDEIKDPIMRRIKDLMNSPHLELVVS